MLFLIEYLICVHYIILTELKLKKKSQSKISKMIKLNWKWKANSSLRSWSNRLYNLIGEDVSFIDKKKRALWELTLAVNFFINSRDIKRNSQWANVNSLTLSLN